MLRPDLGAATGLRVTGNVTLLSSSNLVFQLGGLTQGTQYGYLNVTGNAALGGQLVLSFVNGFQATSNDSFTVLSSTASLTGSFANVASGARLNTTDQSGSFLVNYSGNSIVLSSFILSGGVSPAAGEPSSADAVLPPLLPPSAANAPTVGPLPAVTALASAADSQGSPDLSAVPAVLTVNASTPAPNQPRATEPAVAAPVTESAAIQLHDTTQLLDLLDEAEPVAAGGKAVVRVRRNGQRTNSRERGAVLRGDVLTRREARLRDGETTGESVQRSGMERGTGPRPGLNRAEH